MPCGILVPQPGNEPVPPTVVAQSPSHRTTREVPATFIPYLLGTQVDMEDWSTGLSFTHEDITRCKFLEVKGKSFWAAVQ